MLQRSPRPRIPLWFKLLVLYSNTDPGVDQVWAICRKSAHFSVIEARCPPTPQHRAESSLDQSTSLISVSIAHLDERPGVSNKSVTATADSAGCLPIASSSLCKVNNCSYVEHKRQLPSHTHNLFSNHIRLCHGPQNTRKHGLPWTK
jgi:hypothetical protein